FAWVNGGDSCDKVGLCDAPGDHAGVAEFGSVGPVGGPAVAARGASGTTWASGATISLNGAGAKPAGVGSEVVGFLGAAFEMTHASIEQQAGRIFGAGRRFSRSGGQVAREVVDGINHENILAGFEERSQVEEVSGFEIVAGADLFGVDVEREGIVGGHDGSS